MVESLDDSTLNELRLKLAVAEASQEVLRENEAEVKARARAKFLAMTGISLDGGDSGKEST